MRLSKNGVPAAAVVLSLAGGLVTVVANYFLPTASVFNFLLDSIGATGLFVYLAIAATQLRGRWKMTVADREALPVGMWGHPVLGIHVLVVFVAVLVTLLVDAESRRSTVMSVAATAVAVGAGVVHQRLRRETTADVRSEDTAPTIVAPT
jgi:L-asparagine transporter-like permease